MDTDCSSGYFCGSKLPLNASNYFQNPSANLPGENMYLQETPMALDGLSVVAVTARNHPNLASDLTIFAVVRQEPNNDGYLVGKGINDRMRDFGLYLRSSKRTVWLAYGSDEGGKGFRDILFFYDVSVADGKFHSVTAVVESSVSKATLYIDGEVVGTRTLPSTPQFRPGVSILSRSMLTKSILSLPFCSSTSSMLVVVHSLVCSGSRGPFVTCLSALLLSSLTVSCNSTMTLRMASSHWNHRPLSIATSTGLLASSA